MDTRDPVVMQAIKKVIGTQTVDFGCIGPSRRRTPAIYDEIRRLDVERVQGKNREAAEVERQFNAVVVRPALRMNHPSPSSRRPRPTDVWLRANRQSKAAVGSTATLT